MEVSSQATGETEASTPVNEVQSGWRVTLSTAMKNNLDEVLSTQKALQISDSIRDFSKRLELFNRSLVQMGIIIKGRESDPAKADREEKALLDEGLLMQAKDVLGGAVLKTRVTESTHEREKQQLERTTLKDYIFTNVLLVQSMINTAVADEISPKFVGLDDTLVHVLKDVQEKEDYKFNAHSLEISEKLREADMEHMDVDCTTDGINKVHLSLLDLQTKLSRIEKFYERAVNAYKVLSNEMLPKNTKSDYDNRAKMQEKYKGAFLDFYREVAYFINPETMYEAVDVVRDLFNIEIFVTELGREYKRLTISPKA